MNVLLFISGFGVGTLVASLVIYRLIISAVMKANDNRDDWNRRTIAMMQERNEAAEDQKQSLRTIASWCEHRWNP